MATAKLQYEHMEPSSSVKPFVVHFTNAALKQNIGDKKIRFGCYQWADKADQRKKQRRTVIAETEEMEYIGQNFGQFSRSSGLCKYVLGVYDKKTEVMKMYDTEMITLQPQILGTAGANQEEDAPDSKLDLSFMEKNDLLTEAFGSNRKKRAMASRHRNKVDKNELNETVSDVLESLAKGPMDTTDGGDEQHPYLPPFNINAITATDVYKLDDIITPLEYEALQPASLEIKNANKQKINEWRKKERFPEYVLQHLDRMSVNSSQGLHQSCCCLLYLSYMMTMYGLTNKDLKKKDPLPRMPRVIKERLLSMFSLEKEEAREVPRRLKDKLVSYILVLALMIDEFSLDCTVIVRDLKLPMPRLIKHLRAVGCVITSSNVQRKRKLEDSNGISSKTAVLQVPLPPNFLGHNLHGK
ncbi:DNA-directed RNA polymerase I subunit RPA49-like [Orbicella faveolata]|uniref:DNA-directed RNA polymerase I subunit RPA49-like n=1 Tax=Orbicella faveolata TaxID=48498 RepID=UPI0009E1ABEB|nr:DNA-directed RNA polymerase I subunit RPA49-like [Orbicella faveolata]